MSSSLIRQDLIPIVIGYALIMGALAIGLRIVRRSAPAQEAELAGSRAAPGGTPAASPARRGLRAAIRPGPGWSRLILHYLATAVGGYLILMIVIILYYYLVAPVAGNFVHSAFTGCAMLIGLTLPVFLAASWLAERTGWRF
jgi:uncharacterized membrane protein